MATVFTVVKSFYRQNKKRPLTLNEKKELGSRVLTAWFSQDEIKKPIFRTSVNEPEGKFDALTYPKEFTPTIFRIIEDFYKDLSPPAPKTTRKRIPLKRSAFKSNYLKPK